MRSQFVETTEKLLSDDPRVFLLLGDIGVFGFRRAFARMPDRILNIGILEQASVGVAAGLAKEGFIPIFHSIAPFIVERAFEQIKLDFGYQNLGGVFVSVGGSYDYAALGCTHHCPGDVGIVKAVPGMKIVVPGSKKELDILLRHGYSCGSPMYVRLSEETHGTSVHVQFGKAVKVKEGTTGTVITVGPFLERVMAACAMLDVSLLYYTSLEPFDYEAISLIDKTGSIAVVEPFYEGTLTFDITKALQGRTVKLLSIGVPRDFLRSYGTRSDHDAQCGLTTEAIKIRLERFFDKRG